jgi:uncharacterized protein YbaR (Trm112 family)
MSSDHEQRQDASGRTDRKLLEMLVCPLTRTRLEYDPERQELTSRAARLAFPIRDGVALMTREAARHLDDEAAGDGSHPRD